MHNRAKIIGPILVLALLVGGGYWWWSQRANAAGAGALSGSGTIEAEDVLITSEVAGRVQSLLVDEGQEVTAGQTLAKLDPALLEAQRDQAAAAVAVAEANLALLKACSVCSESRTTWDCCGWRIQGAERAPPTSPQRTRCAPFC